MVPNFGRCLLVKLTLGLAAASLLWNANYTAECCQNSTAGATPGPSSHPSLASCVTEIIRAICGALQRNTSPFKRNTELLNSILSLPRIIQDTGR